MIEYEIVDEFATTPDKYWDMFFSEEYNLALWKHLDIEWELVKFERTGEGQDEVIHRIQRLTPKRDVPAALRRVVKGAVAYEERNVFHRSKSSMETVTIPSFFADKFEAKGVYELVAKGDNKLDRIWRANCKCTVPLVGGKVEKVVVDEVKRSYQASTKFTRQYIAEHLS